MKKSALLPAAALTGVALLLAGCGSSSDSGSGSADIPAITVDSGSPAPSASTSPTTEAPAPSQATPIETPVPEVPPQAVPALEPDPIDVGTVSTLRDDPLKGIKATPLTIKVGETAVVEFPAAEKKGGIDTVADDRAIVDMTIAGTDPYSGTATLKGKAVGKSRIGLAATGPDGKPVGDYTVFEVTVE